MAESSRPHCVSIFPPVGAQTLPELIAATAAPDTVLGPLQQTPYWDADGAAQFRALCPALHTVLEWMQTAQLEQEWAAARAAGFPAAHRAMRAALRSYDVIPLVDEVLGRRTGDRAIEVYVLNFNAPHGIKLVGNRYLTHHSWPIKTTVRTAAHELMHPPYDLAHDAELRQALDTLRPGRLPHAARGTP